MNLSKLVSQKRINRGLWWERAWNLISGCTPVSESCEGCWSARQARLQGARQGLSDYQYRLWGGLTTKGGKWTGKIRCLEENLELPLRTRKPTLFSIWNDFFHPDVGNDFLFNAFRIMVEAKQHFFLILTKRPDRMRSFISKLIDPLPNLGLGVTVELSKYLHRIDTLLQIPAVMHFVSLEPLLDEIDLTDYFHCKDVKTCGLDNACDPSCPYHTALDWVQLGSESGPKRRHTEPRCFEMIIRDCKEAGVPVFFKQMERNGKLVHAPKLANGEPLLQFPEVEL